VRPAEERRGLVINRRQLTVSAGCPNEAGVARRNAEEYLMKARWLVGLATAAVSCAALVVVFFHDEDGPPAVAAMTQGSPPAPTANPEATTVVLPPDEEPITIDLRDPNRKAIVQGLGEWGTLTLPPGWSPGTTDADLVKGAPPKTYWWWQKEEAGILVMFDPETGEVVKTVIPSEANADDSAEAKTIIADLEDRK